MSASQFYGLLSLGLFYALVFAVGVRARRKQSDGSGVNELVLAGRGLPVWIGAFTMTATWVGGGYINGTAEAVYDPSRGLVWCQAPWGYALSLIVGGLLFARPMRRAGFTTMLDPFQARYGETTTALLFLAALLGELFWSAAILAALGMTFTTILGFDIATSILISAAVVIGYTLVGGLWSVAYTDVIQLICILFGLCVAIPFAVDHAGGTAHVVSAYTAGLRARDPFPGSVLANWIDLGLMLVLGGIPWQVYFQRVLACRDERTSVRLSLTAGAACLVMALPAVALGATGAVMDWESAGLEPPSSASMVLPHVLKTLTPPVMATIALGAVAAAVMSSMDSSVLSGATLFAWNVYRPLLRPAAGDRELRWVIRAGVVLFGAATVWLALAVQSVYALWYLCADVVYVVLFPQLVLVLFTKRANHWGALCGTAGGLVLRFGGGEPELGMGAFIAYPLGSNFPFRTLAMLTNLALSWIVSLATTPRTKQGAAR